MKPKTQLIPIHSDELMRFGKYQGLTARDLAVHRPDYLLYLNSLKRYLFDEELINTAQQRVVELELGGSNGAV